LTDDAEADVEEIADHIEVHDSPDRAELVFERIKGAILGLEATPNRGRVVPELRAVGVTDFREILHRPYRIIYSISGRNVHVVAVFDGRRDLEDVLTRRLLR
jgi:toxin ParE1/3/4